MSREVRVVCSQVHGSRGAPVVLGYLIAPSRLVPLDAGAEVDRLKAVSYLQYLRENRGAAPPAGWDPLEHVSSETERVVGLLELHARRVGVLRGRWGKQRRRGAWIRRHLSRDVTALPPDASGVECYQIRCSRCLRQVTWSEPELALRLMYARDRHADLDIASI